jgi:hypothetical protein
MAKYNVCEDSQLTLFVRESVSVCGSPVELPAELVARWRANLVERSELEQEVRRLADEQGVEVT